MATGNSSDGQNDRLDRAADEFGRVEERSRATPYQPSSITTTIGELAQRIDVSPREVLDAVIAAGVCQFWHEGRKFHSPSDLSTYLSRSLHIAPVPELEFDLAADQIARLSAEMGVDIQQVVEQRASTHRNEFAERRQQPTSSLTKALGMSSQHESSDLEKLLMDAAAEIAALDGTDNAVFVRLMDELKSMSQPTEQPGSVTAAKPMRKFAPSDSAAPAPKTNEKTG